jgi:hypothetical protein
VFSVFPGLYLKLLFNYLFLLFSGCFFFYISFFFLLLLFLCFPSFASVSQIIILYYNYTEFEIQTQEMIISFFETFSFIPVLCVCILNSHLIIWFFILFVISGLFFSHISFFLSFVHFLLFPSCLVCISNYVSLL